jgi:CBS domain-containing protein
MTTCRDVMTPDPVCCLANDTVDKAAQVMKNEDVGSVPVVESQESGRLIGIVTDRDLALKVVASGRDSRSTKIQDVMTRNPIACHADDDLQMALDAMAEYQVRRIPVVDRDNVIVGIIAQADVATRTENPRETAQVVEEISKPA